MVTLNKLRLDMEKQLQVDKDITTVEVIGETLDECLADAAVQLETKTSNLEYEVIEKGSQGIIGLMKKPWRIKVYENPELIQKKKKAAAVAAGQESEVIEEIQIANTDGSYFVHRFASNIFVKVNLPEGEGKPVDPDDLINAAIRPDNTDLDEELLRKLAKEGTNGEYVEVGDFNHISVGDAVMAVDISKDEMQATITVSAPTAGGCEISEEKIINALSTQGVVAGIDEDRIIAFVDTPSYNSPYVVASAILPQNGTDAYIQYNFETDKTKLKLKETANGQVDFKELNLIQNVVAGQPLAKKILPTRGKGGKTIMGRYLKAKNGKDIGLPIGQNTVLDKDGCTILAEKNGHVSLVGDKINVEEIYEVQGVNIKTGNITYMGTVLCRGDVEDGFDIKADGNIEIYGSVGRCKIEAGGDIVISQGVMGRDECEIVSSKSVWARFIQNAKVEAKEYVVVNDNIMNSDVYAMKKVLLKGKRASIIGGNVFATEEISAKNIGSSGGGIVTKLSVGFDPEKKKRLAELQELQANLVKELEEVELNIQTLENNKKVRRSLPKEKEESLNAFYGQKTDLVAQNEEYTKEIDEINERLRELKNVGCVNASGTVYPGVEITVRDEKDEVKSETKAVTFFYDNGFVKRGKFDPSQVSDVGAPDGYSAN